MFNEDIRFKSCIINYINCLYLTSARSSVSSWIITVCTVKSRVLSASPAFFRQCSLHDFSGDHPENWNAIFQFKTQCLEWNNITDHYAWKRAIDRIPLLEFYSTKKYKIRIEEYQNKFPYMSNHAGWQTSRFQNQNHLLHKEREVRTQAICCRRHDYFHMDRIRKSKPICNLNFLYLFWYL